MKHDRLIPLTADVAALADAGAPPDVAAFMAACPGAGYLQDPDWPAYAPARGGRHDYALATVRTAAGALVLAGLLRRSVLPGGVWLGAFRRGPLVRDLADLAPALSALLPVLKSAGYASVTLNPRWYGTEADRCAAALADLGAAEVGDDRQTLHSVTGLVDLAPPLEEILAGFSKRARPIFRKLERGGLTVRPMMDADVDTYAAWRAAFVADRGMSVSGQPGVAAQLDHVRTKGGLAAMAELNGAPCGAFVGFRDGDRILPVADAWADPNAKLPRGYLFLWALIRVGHDMQGLRWLDVGGLSDPSRIAARDPEAARRAEQRDAFKMHLRPDVVRMPRIREFVLRPMLHRVVMAAKKAV